MKTVKEVSELTGISARTLHYYDEIGLFPPTDKSEAGYRLYDDQAIERLQQILYFRELDIPLKEIKAIMDDSSVDKTKIFQMQRDLLVTKNKRIERLIVSLDEILRGDNHMDFSIFTKSEIKTMFQIMFDSMTTEMRQAAINKFGSVEEWRKHYIEVLSSEDMQKRYAKIVEWYGGKEEYMDTLKNPISKEVAESFKNREDCIRKKLIERRGCDLNSFETKEIIGEYGFVIKQLCQVKEEKELMLAIAKSYRENKCKKVMDKQYGEGASEYFAQAIERFYEK